MMLKSNEKKMVNNAETPRRKESLSVPATLRLSSRKDDQGQNTDNYDVESVWRYGL
jgi:hypothetical protein